MRMSSAFCITGWLSIYFAKDALALDVGRLATGYGMGVFSYVVPVFIAEIAPKNLRGALTTLNQLMISCGVSTSFLIGQLLPWRNLALFSLVPSAIMLVGLLFIPESPRWLAKIGKQKEFEAALQQLRGKEADTSSEATEIQDSMESLQQLPQAKLRDLFQIRYLRSVTIGVGLMVCQQFGGINGVVFYLRQTFVSAGFPPDLGTTICAILPIFVTALGVSLIDRAGRRALLLVSATGLVLGCLLDGAAFFMKDHELLLDAVPALTVTGILVYIGSFSIGMGAVPWVVMSEIFPINVKGVAGSLATLVSWFGTWVASYTYNYLMSWSTYGTFMIYALINGLAIIFIARVVPETKGRTLEEIQATINNHEEDQEHRK
ncbi:sugar transporter ERD6-like 7 isoform X1 [Papaver somniferum]|nr:sugar transporter ERD6-like 7 isoform X1 [Papaver somniferum]